MLKQIEQKLESLNLNPSKKMFVFCKLEIIFEILRVDLTNRIFFLGRFGPFLEFQTLALPP